MNKPLRKQKKNLVCHIFTSEMISQNSTLLIASILDVFSLVEAFNEDVL